MDIFGLIGFPLGHSFSKKYFTDKFAKENIDAVYKNYEINTIEKLHGIVNNEKKLKGLNVTIPYKEKVTNLLDELDETAREIGAVNVIKIHKKGTINKLKGYNSDAYGFEMALKKKLTPYHNKALILGTGGASKAIAYTLKKLNINFTFVSTRKRGKNILAYEELTKDIITIYSLIINATPLGTHPNIDTYPNIPYSYLTGKHYLFDLVYNPQKTTFLSKGEQQNTLIMNGYKMLTDQAEKAWEIWNR